MYIFRGTVSRDNFILTANAALVLKGEEQEQTTIISMFFNILT